MIKFGSMSHLKKLLKEKWDQGLAKAYVPDDWTWNDFWDYIKFDAIIERKAINKRKKQEQNKKAEAVLVPSFNKFANAFIRASPIIAKAHRKMMDKKKKELRKRERLFSDIDTLDILLNIGNFAIVKQDVEAPKVSDYDPEEDDLVKRTKIILASKMIQLKRLIKKHPFVAKHIYNQLNALNKFIERGNYKQAIIFTNELIARVERVIADEEGKVVLLEITKAEKQARANIIETMDKLAERLQLDESQLLGKEDGLSSDHFEEEDEDEVKKEYFSEEEARKQEREKQRIKEGKYVKKPPKTKPSKPPKVKQYGNKPWHDKEDKSILTTYPIEYEKELKAREQEEKEKDRLAPLKEAFEDLTPEEKGELLRSLLKRKMKEVDS